MNRNVELRKNKFRQLLDKGDLNQEDFADFMNAQGRFKKAEAEDIMPVEYEDDFAQFIKPQQPEQAVSPPPSQDFQTRFTERRKLEAYIRNLLTNLVSKVRSKKGMTLDTYEAIIERMIKKLVMKFADSADSVLNESVVNEIIIKCLLEE